MCLQDGNGCHTLDFITLLEFDNFHPKAAKAMLEKGPQSQPLSQS